MDVNDQTLSHLTQPLVRIALKLLQLFRAHRAAHATGGGAYVPPDDAAAQNQWMANEHDRVCVFITAVPITCASVVAVQELEAEFTTQYVKEKIDSTTVINTHWCREIQPRGQ